MYKIIAIMGKAGSGKDALLQCVLQTDPTLHEIISCTTRPRREGEVNGVNYFYCTPGDFTNKIYKHEMLEYTVFNNWYYGTSYDSVKENVINVGVFNPAGVRSLITRADVDVKIFFLDVDDKTRLLRQLKREQHPNVDEIIRRYSTDKEDFKDIWKDFNIIPLHNDNLKDLLNNTKIIRCEINAWKRSEDKEH